MYKPEDISNFEILSSYLRTSREALDAFSNGVRIILDPKSNLEFQNSDNHQPNQYTLLQRFYIPKRNKKLGYRVVYKLVSQTPKDILKVLKFNLNILYSPMESVHGFVRDRNTLTNASCHLGAKFLLKLDIKNFFESINTNSVMSGFESLGFTAVVSNELAKITTLGGTLVQGYSTSPILANIVCAEMDEEIKKICSKENAIYTRYADDISISSSVFFEKKESIEKVLSKYGFELNNSKTQRFKRGQNQYVTGLSVSDKLHPRIPKQIKKRLRQQIHFIKLYGYHSHVAYVNKLDEKKDYHEVAELARKLSDFIKGWIDYMKPIEPILSEKMLEEFNIIEEVEQKKNEARFMDFLNESGFLEEGVSE